MYTDLARAVTAQKYEAVSTRIVGCRNASFKEWTPSWSCSLSSRVTGKLGVCVVNAGPGFTNAITAILNAQVDATPTLFIIGAAPLREAETNPLQGGFDQIAMITPGCKWAVRITHTERMPDLVAMAIRQATDGRRGAVVIEVPIDILHMSANPVTLTKPAGLQVQPRPAPSANEVRRAIDVLHSAARPAIIVGGEARFCDCEASLKRFAEQTGIPVFSRKRGLGLLPTHHPLDGHEASNLASLVATKSGPDAVLLLGTLLGLFLGGRKFGVVPENARLIQVYSDATEIGRIRDIEVPIAAHCGATLDALIEASHDLIWPNIFDWSNRAVAVKHEAAALYSMPEGIRGIRPYHAVAAVIAEIDDSAVYAIDGGEAGQWAVQQTKVDGPGRVTTTGYLGGLGVGPGYAIGAQVAAPERRVILFTGDGSFGFHIQELDTMIRHRLPIITVV